MNAQPEPKKTDGDLIRETRIKAGLSQSELARRTGVSQSYISEIEAGNADTLTLATLRKIAAALDIHPRYLIGD